MKFKRAAIYLLCALAICIFAGGLVSCSGGQNEYDGVKVVFELEGGTFKNSKRAIVYYYDLKEDASALLKRPEEYDTRYSVIRQGFHIVEWCKTRTENADGSISYSDPWDFAHDTVSGSEESVTLYAVWATDVIHTYEICYVEEDGSVSVVYTYEVSEGDAFRDRFENANTRNGYTAERVMNENGELVIGYYDEDGNPWDPSFTHPGGEESLAIRVFVRYIEGTFTYVTTASELTSAVARGQNIYLYNDIDFEGKDFSGFKNATSGKYSATLKGNGHSIKNFNLSYAQGASNLVNDNDFGTNALCISLFGILENATVENVSFEDVTIAIRANFSQIRAVYVAPIGVKAVNSKVENVSFSGSITCERLLDGISEEEENFHVETEKLVYITSGSSVSGEVNVVYTDERTNN